MDIPSKPQLFLFGRLIICDTDSSCISVNLKPFLFLFLRNIVKLFAVVHGMRSARLGPVSVKI